MKKITFLLLAVLYLFASSVTLFSQVHSNHDRCGTMGHLEMLEKEYPKIIKNRAKIEAYTQKVLKNKNPLQKTQGIITIPVVVHVLYYTAEENISDAQVLSQINVLNEDFRRLNADASNTPADFLPVAADSEIEFCLATRDPNGNPSTGITRTYTTNEVWGFGTDMAFSSQGGVDAWNAGDYLNIWVCNLGESLLGFAQFPGGSAATDGVVCNTRFFGNTGYVEAPFDLGRTMTHEVGHWLNLYHIWGDGDCSVDDLVADTPNAAYPNTTFSPCTYPENNSCDEGEGDLPDMFQNYMDYSEDACFNLFTIGQKDRMRALFEPGGFRESLLNSTGCDPLPAHCSNNAQDGDETNVDCGGSCLPCVSCSDGIQNGEELDIDCGGSDCVPCSGCTDPFAHNYNPISGLDDGSCETCTDNVQNGDETGIDCGGTFCFPCREDALELACGDIVTGSSNSNSNSNLPALCGSSFFDVFNNGTWFSFEGTGEALILSVDFAATNSFFLLEVLVEDGDELTCVTNGLQELEFVTQLGTTYYLYLYEFFGFEADFELRMGCSSCSNGIQDGDEEGVDCGGSFCNVCGDVCEGALLLGCDAPLIGSTFNSSSTDLPATCGDDVHFPFRGVWFTFEGTGENMILSTDNPGTGYDTNLQLYSGDCNNLTCIAGNEDGGGIYVNGWTSELSFLSEPNTVYYLYLSGYSGSRGNYELSKICYSPLNINVTSVLGVPSNGVGTGGIGISATGGYTACGPLTYAWTGPNNYTATSESITGLTVAGLYTLTVTDCLGNEITESINVPVRGRGGRGRSRKADFTETTQLAAIPNPFRSETQIHFEVETNEAVTLEVFDIQGAKVATLFEGWAEAGQKYQIAFGDSIPVGTYIANLTTASGEVQHIKLLLIK